MSRLNPPQDDEELVDRVRSVVIRERGPGRLGALNFSSAAGAATGPRPRRSLASRLAVPALTAVSATAVVALSLTAVALHARRSPSPAEPTATMIITPASSAIAQFSRLTYTDATSAADAAKFQLLEMNDTPPPALLSAIRRSDPSVKVLAYMTLTAEVSNPQGIGTCFPFKAGAAGVGGIPVAYFLRDASGKPLATPNGSAYYLDPSNAAVQKACAQAAIRQFSGYSGVMWQGPDARLDFSGVRSCPGGSPACQSETGLAAAGAAFYRDVVPQLHAHALISLAMIGGAYGSAQYQAVWSQWGQYLDGAMDASFAYGINSKPVPRTQTDDQLRNIAWSEANGKYYFAHGTLPANDEPGSTYALALMLLQAGGKTSWDVGEGCNTCELWPASYARAQQLGKPLGTYSVSGSVYSRRFENGTVTVDVEAHTATIG